MSDTEEEPYSTIFASLKHPIRRRILRMLSKKPMNFSEMLAVLGVSSSFLTYHLENLGELIGKTDEGKYRLSSFGEAAMATMTKVEDIPTNTFQQFPETKPRRVVRRSTAIALGIICILLIASLGGIITYYTMTIRNQISQLNSTVANLQKQVASDNSTISSLTSLVASLLLQNQLNDNVEGLDEQLGLQLTMTLQKTNYSLGEPINMTFTITNISNQTIILEHYGAVQYDSYNFEFWVFNDTNIVCSLMYPVYAFNPGGPVISYEDLNPEESITGVLVWDQCNSTIFSEGVPVSPGTYYIVGQIGPIFLNGLTIETTPIQIVIG